MANESSVFCISAEFNLKIHKWKVREGFQVTNNQVILLYKLLGSDDPDIKRFKANQCGVVKRLLFKDGDIVNKGYVYNYL